MKPHGKVSAPTASRLLPRVVQGARLRARFVAATLRGLRPRSEAGEIAKSAEKCDYHENEYNHEITKNLRNERKSPEFQIFTKNHQEYL